MKAKRTNSLNNSLPMRKLNMVSAAVLCATSLGANSAPGTLAESPLFLSTNVPANIFFLIDDSGSMDWEVLLSNEAQAAYGGAPNSGNMDFTPNNDTEVRELCVGYNVLAYDPSKTYTPWIGVDSNGNAYPDMTLSAARRDPYYTTTNSLTSHFYIEWADNGDGIFQAGECPVPSGYGDTLSSTECAAASNCVTASSLSAAQQQNYANWYSYYVKREYVAKRALSEIVTNSTARMGLATLHNNNSVRTLMRDVDDITTPVDTTAQANKLSLLDNLFDINSSGGTPLRQRLEDVGEYYEGSSSWGPSPILPVADGGECQQNFTIMMTDGVWNGNTPSVGNADTDNNTTWDGGLFADQSASASNTLADVAMHYYERDLAPGLSDNVRTITGVDNNEAQHMVTYTVAFGVTGTLPATSNPGDAGFAWPTPSSNQTTTIDDVRHAAYNGRGDFLSAANPQDLIDSLSNSIADIQSRTGTAAAVSFNSTSLQTTTNLLKASFNSDRWSGDLIAYDIDIANNTLGSIAWRASTDLDARTTVSRNIITYDGSAGTIFDWASITTAQKDDLRTNSGGTLDNEATGMARLDYVRGQRACESNNSGGTCSYTDSGGGVFNTKSLRPRNSRLGDIIHSSPFYVGAPNTRYPDNIELAPYSTFAQTWANRAGISYVGSNDGMMHAFDENGVEVFAYIPNLLYSTASGDGLHDLSDPGYMHDYYVDLSVAVADAYVDLTGGGTRAWKSVLVGGLRGGGKGLFAMDVTDPSALSTASGAAGKVLWEFTHNDLGYTYSDIRIGKLNNGKWAAIFGNGYNSDPSGDGTSKIFIVYLDGSNLASPIILETGQGSINNNNCADPASDCNGMATPAIGDLNGNGTIDRIYAGDLHGKLWAFDVSSSNPSNWQSAYGTAPTFTPLFHACNGSPCTTANRQPITEKPAVARHPSRRDLTTAPNLMVFFGTGQYLSAGDGGTTDTQTFYGVWDSGSGNVNRGALQTQAITDDVTGQGVEVRTVTDNDVDYNTQRGWRFDLPTAGERSVTNPLAYGSLLFFNTVIPSSSTCAAGGDGWLMAVDLFNGGEPNFQPIDVNGDGVFDLADQVGGTYSVGTKTSGIPTESKFISDRRVTATSDGTVLFEKIRPSNPRAPERMSWTNIER